LWIAPDILVPDYRQHWLFQNAITGKLSSSFATEHRGNSIALVFRFIRAAVLVPIIEELFWRAWLMRWLQSQRFHTVPLGRWTWSSMIITAVLFASEHGPFWEVGLMAGFAYNFLMVRTRSLGDCILAHAITNACLSAWVIWSGQWEYWM
jgi:CAAX prenyl protease-like protein